MMQLLIVLQGLLYTGLVVTLLARGRRAGGPWGAAALSLAAHLLVLFVIPAEWHVTWLVFVVPGHILTPALLLVLARRNTGD